MQVQTKPTIGKPSINLIAKVDLLSFINNKGFRSISKNYQSIQNCEICEFLDTLLLDGCSVL